LKNVVISNYGFIYENINAEIAGIFFKNYVVFNKIFVSNNINANNVLYRKEKIESVLIRVNSKFI